MVDKTLEVPSTQSPEKTRPDAERSYADRERLGQDVKQAMGRESMSVFHKGLAFGHVMETSSEQDADKAIASLVEGHLERAIETEKDPEVSFEGHDDYVEKCLTELNDIKPEDIERVQGHLEKKLSRLPEEQRAAAQKEMGNYFDAVRRIMDTRSKEGPFFSQARRFMESNPFRPKTDDTDMQRRVTVRAYSQLLYPLMETMAAMETERLKDEYGKINMETQEFAAQAFPDLSQEELAKRGEGLQYEVKSILVKDPDEWESTGGYHERGKIVIAYGNRESRNTVTHETLHGLSYDGNTSRFEDGELSGNASRNLTEAVVTEAAMFGDDLVQASGPYLAQRESLAVLRRAAMKNQGQELPLAVLVTSLIRHEPLSTALERQGYTSEQKKSFFEQANKLFG